MMFWRNAEQKLAAIAEQAEHERILLERATERAHTRPIFFIVRCDLCSHVEKEVTQKRVLSMLAYHYVHTHERVLKPWNKTVEGE